jgi:hypothetical protein
LGYGEAGAVVVGVTVVFVLTVVVVAVVGGLVVVAGIVVVVAGLTAFEQPAIKVAIPNKPRANPTMRL